MILATVIAAWERLRVEPGYSNRLAQVATARLGAQGYRGRPDVTVSRKSGGKWRITSYSPSPKDDPMDPSDHGRRLFALIETAGQDFPSYPWTDRRLIIMFTAFAIAAAVSVLFGAVY
ncbi:MAG: hypothetical protein WB778_00735 [Thermoplasmata archaeon]